MPNAVRTVIEAADALAAVIAAEAPKTWSEGLTDAQLERLAESGLLDPFSKQPPSDAATVHLEAPRLLARHCGSTAWLVAAAGRASACLSGIPGDAAHEVRSDEGLRFATFGVCSTDDCVWRAVPAAAQAPWFVLTVTTPEPSFLLVPRSAVKVTPLEHFGGLRGANLGDVTLTGDQASVRRFNFGEGPYAGLAAAGVSLGLAEGAFRDYVAITRKRVNSTGGAAVAQFAQVQVRLAEVDAELDAVRALFARLTQTGGAALARDAAFIARRSLRAATQLVQQMGAQGIAEANAVQRHVRDLRAAASDASVDWDRGLAAHGRELLGIAPAST